MALGDIIHGLLHRKSDHVLRQPPGTQSSASRWQPHFYRSLSTSPTWVAFSGHTRPTKATGLLAACSSIMPLSGQDPCGHQGHIKWRLHVRGP